MRKLSLFCLCLAAAMVACKPIEQSELTGIPSAAKQIPHTAFLNEIANYSVSLNVGVLDTKGRKLFNKFNVGVEYPSNTYVNVSVASYRPVDFRFSQKNPSDGKHGLWVNVLGNALKYHVSSIKFFQKEDRFEILTDPKGVGLTGAVISQALNWYLPKKIPSHMKEYSYSPQISTLEALSKSSADFINNSMSGSSGQNPSLTGLRDLSIYATISFPIELDVNIDNHTVVSMKRGASISISLLTEGTFSNPKVKAINIAYSGIKIREISENPLENFANVAFLESFHLDEFGNGELFLRTLVSEEKVRLKIEGKKIHLITEDNPTMPQEKIYESISEFLPQIIPVLEHLDAGFSQVNILQSVGL